MAQTGRVCRQRDSVRALHTSLEKPQVLARLCAVNVWLIHEPGPPEPSVLQYLCNSVLLERYERSFTFDNPIVFLLISLGILHFSSIVL